MSNNDNQAVRGFYQLTETIKSQLLSDPNVNTVTTGELSQVNLNKQDIFPMCHIIINSVTIEEQVLRFNITLLTMDIVNMQKQETIDIFTGNTNEQDILNTQLSVINKVVQVLKRGTLYTNKYQLDGDPVCEPFFDRFENELVGWSANMDIIINNDITIC